MRQVAQRTVGPHLVLVLPAHLRRHDGLGVDHGPRSDGIVGRPAAFVPFVDGDHAVIGLVAGGVDVWAHDDKLGVRGFGDEVRRSPGVPCRHVGLGRDPQVELAALVHHGEPLLVAPVDPVLRGLAAHRVRLPLQRPHALGLVPIQLHVQRIRRSPRGEAERLAPRSPHAFRVHRPHVPVVLRIRRQQPRLAQRVLRLDVRELEPVSGPLPARHPASANSACRSSSTGAAACPPAATARTGNRSMPSPSGSAGTVHWNTMSVPSDSPPSAG